MGERTPSSSDTPTPSEGARATGIISNRFFRHIKSYSQALAFLRRLDQDRNGEEGSDVQDIHLREEAGRMKDILSNELVQKYFGCEKCDRPLTDCLVEHVSYRVIKAMEVPIKKGEYCLSLGWPEIEKVDYMQLDYFHPAFLRLPDSFQPPSWRPVQPVQSANNIQLVLCEVEDERYRQEKKWGKQNHPVEDYYTVLAEEFGEVGKAICEFRLQKKGSLDDIRAELIQTAAVAVAMVESLDRNGR